jgi:hypothetical protein
LLTFLVVKYASLGLTSVRALLLAALLGPMSYGVLGTLVLAQQNLSYAALGVREGLTVKLAQAHADPGLALQISSSALLWAWCVGALILGTSMVLVGLLGLGSTNWIWVAVIAALSITNEMLININRDRNRIVRVALLELVFNAAPLCAALVFMHSVTVTIVLMAMAAGLFASVLLYSVGGLDFRWREVRAGMTRRLVTAGIPLALLSFVTTALASIFVFSASAMHLGDTVGLLVFGNSLTTIILFGLNMVAWAATAKSMKRLHANAAETAGERGARLIAFFRIGIILAASCLLALKLLFAHLMRPYAGSEVYAVYFCLLQAYALLLFRELNFLAVRLRSLWVAAGYGIILAATVATAFLAPQLGMVVLMQICLGLLCFFSLGCVLYCRRLGFKDSRLRSQAGFLTFPLLFGLFFGLGGAVGGLAVAAVFVAAWLQVHAADLRSLMTEARNA